MVWWLWNSKWMCWSVQRSNGFYTLNLSNLIVHAQVYIFCNTRSKTWKCNKHLFEGLSRNIGVLFQTTSYNAFLRATLSRFLQNTYLVYSLLTHIQTYYLSLTLTHSHTFIYLFTWNIRHNRFSVTVYGLFKFYCLRNFN